MNARDLEALLVERVADLLEVDPTEIDPSAPHASYGLDSATALMLAADLEEDLGVPMPDSLAWDYPTLRELAAHLEAQTQGETQ